MNLKTKIEKLEARHKTGATVCPHLPILVREIASDGTQLSASDTDTCDCGRERLEVQLVETDDYHAPV